MRLVRRLQPVFFVLALAFMGLLLRSQWAQLQAYSWEIQGLWLAASALLLLASWAMEIKIWQHLLAFVGGELPFVPAVRIWFISAIMRYIPGNIWQPLSMSVQCRQRGIRPEATLTSIVLYQVVILLAVVPIAAFYLLWGGNLGLLAGLLRGAAPGLTTMAVVLVAVVVVRPALLLGVVNWLLARLGREMLPVRLSSGRLLLLLLAAAGNWLLWGGAFAALTFALSAYSPGQIAAMTPHLVAAYPIAYAIGFVSFVTPSGFGVREGAFYLLLAPLMAGAPVTLAALAMRLWTTAGELTMAGISLMLVRDARPRPIESFERLSVE